MVALSTNRFHDPTSFRIARWLLGLAGTLKMSVPNGSC